MARYTYHGPFQTLELRKGNGNDGKSEFEEVTLAPGSDPITLPEDNPSVVSMLDAGLLRLVPAKSRPASNGAKSQEGEAK